MSYTDFANQICQKAQVAAQLMIQARITANSLEAMLPVANVFAGIESRPITSTRVVCECKRAVPSENFEANWDADLSIRVIAPYADIEQDDFHELCGQVFAFFFQTKETVAARLSNSDVVFTCQFVVPVSTGWDFQRTKDGDLVAWESEMNFRINCCGSNIA